MFVCTNVQILIPVGDFKVAEFNFDTFFRYKPVIIVCNCEGTVAQNQKSAIWLLFIRRFEVSLNSLLITIWSSFQNCEKLWGRTHRNPNMMHNGYCFSDFKGWWINFWSIYNPHFEKWHLVRPGKINVMQCVDYVSLVCKDEALFPPPPLFPLVSTILKRALDFHPKWIQQFLKSMKWHAYRITLGFSPPFSPPSAAILK